MAVDDANLNYDRDINISNVASGGIYTGVSRNVTMTVYDNDCGYWGFLASDFNEDCKVDMQDLAEFALDWLDCTHPQGVDCVNVAF